MQTCIGKRKVVRTMKALVVRQPYASLIAGGWKTIETRTWKTDYRGPLAICAGKKLMIPSHPVWDIEFVRDWRDQNLMPMGCIVAVAMLVNIRSMRDTKVEERRACCPWIEGTYSWVLRDVIATELIPVRGRLGLFEIPEFKESPREMPW